MSYEGRNSIPAALLGEEILNMSIPQMGIAPTIDAFIVASLCHCAASTTLIDFPPRFCEEKGKRTALTLGSTYPIM